MQIGQQILCLNKDAQPKIKCRIFIDYCGIIQNIKDQSGEMFIADSFMKSIEDIVLNNFDEYIFLQIFVT